MRKALGNIGIAVVVLLAVFFTLAAIGLFAWCLMAASLSGKALLMTIVLILVVIAASPGDFS